MEWTMRQGAAMLALVGLTLLVCGCASTMMVFTEPGNAEILVEGEPIGRSPVLYAGHSSLDGAVQVTVRLPGYQETTVDVWRELNIAHLGAWFLPDSVHIQLKPVQK